MHLIAKILITSFTCALLHRCFGADPFLLPFPPLVPFVNRVKALLHLHKSDATIATFPLHSRLFLLGRFLYYLLMSPIWLLIWNMDDILYPEYKEESLEEAVFLVGGFRTGSTSLHRALSLDEERFVR